MTFNSLEIREVFHLEFLRSFVRLVKPGTFALKGGSNLRFFFGSIRYSEDMDLDLAGIPVHEVQEKVMKILISKALLSTLQTYRINRLDAPDLSVAKQTATVQRFKVHLHTEAGLDLFTKIEFSRRGLESPFRPEAVLAASLGRYKLGPLIVPHYLAGAALRQKVKALASRKQVEARDLFDLYTLSTQPEAAHSAVWIEVEKAHLLEARERIFSIQYSDYQDKVIPYLLSEDRENYHSELVWDEIRLRVEELIGKGIQAHKRGKKGEGS